MAGFEVHDGVVGDPVLLVVRERVAQVRDVPDADAVGVGVQPSPPPQEDVPQKVGEVVRRPGFGRDAIRGSDGAERY